MSSADTGAAPPTPPRLRLAANWLLGLGLAGAAATGPAIAEAHIESRLRGHDRFGDGLHIDINLAGVELRRLSHALPGNEGRVLADRVRVRPGFDGIQVEIEGLRVSAVDEPPPAPSIAPAAADSSTPAASSSEDQLERLLSRLRGIPIEITHRGPVELELGQGLWADVDALSIVMPGDGRILADAQLELRSHRGGPAWLDATLEVESSDLDPRSLSIAGSITTDSSEDSLTLDADASPAALELDLQAPSGGRAHLSVSKSAATGDALARLDANQLPLASFGSLLAFAADGLDTALGEGGSRPHLDAATLDGAVEFTRHGPQMRARFERLSIEGLALDADRLAAETVDFGSLTIDGELGRDQTPEGPLSFAALIVAHDDVQLDLSGQLDAEHLHFDIRLPNSPCQDVLDATPGLSPVLAGTELAGTLDAHFGLDLDLPALARARTQYRATEGESFENEAFEPPGQLRFDLPYLEQCEVLRLGPGVDIPGLRGAYRHDFTSAGVTKRRVLGSGDTDYVPIARIPRLALAFVILEDSMFERHDGFDREQLERAFWFNVLEGRVSRGASTITQQTARTLWLGIDRSLSRKLAEAMLAAELERGLGKRRILELYLNLIELGPEVHGVAEAARYHFGKEARQLTLVEALHLASLAPAPVAYSRRFASGEVDEAWRDHLRLQVRRLAIRKLITPEIAQEAMRVRLPLRQH